MADASGLLHPEEPPVAPEQKTAKPKRDRKEDPRLADKVWKFVQPWNWEVEKNDTKRIKLPTIVDIVALDKKGWEIVSTWAGRVGVTASLFNFALVTIYACTIASQSTFGLLEGADPWVRLTAWFLLMLLATGIAGVLQLATDYGLPWASGLAFEKYRLSPSAIIIAWAVFFLPTTLIMKYDLYSSWGHERQSEIVLAQTETANDAVVLRKFEAGPPPAIEASQSIIDAGPAALLALQAERERLVAAREQEKEYIGNSGTGMGPNWRLLNEQVLAQDTLIREQEGKVTAARVTLQDRKDYDAAKARQEGNAKITANGGAALTLLYDHPVVVWLRVLGGSFVAIIGILVYFVALKKLSAERAAAEAKEKNRKRGEKGWDTRRNAPTDADYEETAPFDAIAIPYAGPVETAVVAPADTPRRVKPDGGKHPDKAGDEKHGGANGYGDDVTTSADEESDADESGKPAAD